MTHQYAVEVILDHYKNMTAESVIQRLRYSSFVSLSKRYMYFEVPRAACTQMKELLRTMENAPPIRLFTGGLPVTRRDMFVHARENVPLPSLADLDNKTQREVLEAPDFFRMTFVRNPYTRLASLWKARIMLCDGGGDMYLQIKGHLPEFHTNEPLISLDEFVEHIVSKCDLRTCDPHWRRQVDHVFFPALNFSCVAKVERMADGLRRFEQHLGLSEPLVADGRNISAFKGGATYTKELADKVYSLYQPDFEVLGYDRNTWPAGGENANETSGNAAVQEESFRREIVERNIIISALYQERDRLQAELRSVSRLHLLGIVHGLVALYRVSRKFLLEVKVRMRGVFRSGYDEQQRDARTGTPQKTQTLYPKNPRVL